MEPTIVETPHGPARVHLHAVEAPLAGLVLGHGAGGGVAAPDLVAATQAALGLGIAVALVEQPYRVAGRRSAAPASRLDAAWLAVCAHLQAHELHGLRLIAGGRSSGARVACRTATQAGAIAVLCLAFPLRPPGAKERPSRLSELEGVPVPVLVVQGERDPFGMPEPYGAREVAVVPGDHALRSAAAVGTAVHGWLERVVR